MAERSKQPAALLRKIARLEDLLEAEKAAHAKTFDNYRENVWELVELKQRHERAVRVMAGEE